MKSLLRSLLETAPVPGKGERETAVVLADYFRSHGIEPELDEWDGDRANLIVRLPPSDGASGVDGEKPLCIIGHLDVVPADPHEWSMPPFEVTDRDGRLFGRGTADMLGGIAAVAAALVDSAGSGRQRKREIVFAATAGEETDSCGIIRFLERFRHEIPSVYGTLVPEPTGLRVLRGHRGILWVEIVTRGKTAHGSMPHLGVNALLKMQRVIEALDPAMIAYPAHRELGPPTMSPNRISGGTATNVVPDRCLLEVDIRTLPGQEQDAVLGRLDALLADLASADPDFRSERSVLRAVPALETAGDDPFLLGICRSAGVGESGMVAFTTDGPFAAALGPVVLFGPGQPEMCHKPDEYVETIQLDQARTAYGAILSGHC